MEENEVDVVNDAFFAFSMWAQNFFGVVIPIAGILLEGWLGFFIGTGISLLFFLFIQLVKW